MILDEFGFLEECDVCHEHLEMQYLFIEGSQFLCPKHRTPESYWAAHPNEAAIVGLGPMPSPLNLTQ